jgi:hypothetical protein
MQIRFFAPLMAVLLAFAAAASAKCPATLVEVRGSVADGFPSEAKVRVTVFAHKRRNPLTETFNLEGNSFSKTVAFSTLSRSGLWGDQCHRSPEEVVIELIDKDGREIDRAVLDLRRDVELGPKGMRLRAVVLRGEP